MTLGAARVVVLVRDGCHLCAESLAIVEAVCAQVGVTWRSVDIDAEPELRAEHTDHVPVTFVDGALHARWFVDAERLQHTLRQGSGRPC